MPDALAETWSHRLLRALGWTSLIVFVAWNSLAIVQGLGTAPILKDLTGIPCPTTGCTRATYNLLQGNVAESLRYNAMTVPILALLAVTVGTLVSQRARRGRWRLPKPYLWVWLVTLAIAWILKLSGDRSYW